MQQTETSWESLYSAQSSTSPQGRWRATRTFPTRKIYPQMVVLGVAKIPFTLPTVNQQHLVRTGRSPEVHTDILRQTTVQRRSGTEVSVLASTPLRVPSRGARMLPSDHPYGGEPRLIHASRRTRDDRSALERWGGIPSTGVSGQMEPMEVVEGTVRRLRRTRGFSWGRDFKRSGGWYRLVQFLVGGYRSGFSVWRNFWV